MISKFSFCFRVWYLTLMVLVFLGLGTKQENSWHITKIFDMVVWHRVPLLGNKFKTDSFDYLRINIITLLENFQNKFISFMWSAPRRRKGAWPLGNLACVSTLNQHTRHFGVFSQIKGRVSHLIFLNGVLFIFIPKQGQYTSCILQVHIIISFFQFSKFLFLAQFYLVSTSFYTFILFLYQLSSNRGEKIKKF